MHAIKVYFTLSLLFGTIENTVKAVNRFKVNASLFYWQGFCKIQLSIWNCKNMFYLTTRLTELSKTDIYYIIQLLINLML